MESVSFDLDSISKINYYYFEVIGIIVIVVAMFVIKKIHDKNKCPYCKLKIEKGIPLCPRCGNPIK